MARRKDTHTPGEVDLWGNAPAADKPDPTPLNRKRSDHRIGDDAVINYRRHGWTIGSTRAVGLGQVMGPCDECGEPTVKYGPNGNKRCPTCRGCKGATVKDLHHSEPPADATPAAVTAWRDQIMAGVDEHVGALRAEVALRWDGKDRADALEQLAADLPSRYCVHDLSRLVAGLLLAPEPIRRAAS